MAQINSTQAKENEGSALVQSKESDLEEQPQESEDSTTKPSFELNQRIWLYLLPHCTSPNPSFSISFVAEMTVKNPNFGYFRYGITSAGVRGVSTRRINAVMNLNSNNLRNDTNLESDLRSEALTLMAQSNMEAHFLQTS
ncbi:hypothetical protein ES319_A11G202800v1 [Gossypium barbadense]|uniref:Uncharacterized protein n=2 Tax=Gossypium TaxID=3633 RepID=A0A5J5TR34_GOSBA|nr:hypothetical protein ES319_A11G202800v1 [Gossypium barbadense]TYG94810.1 hypothetical protein ES288_A11G218200v1 [Gossypium darwinii]